VRVFIENEEHNFSLFRYSSKQRRLIGLRKTYSLYGRRR
jgi:hypothetical protein